MIRDMYITLLPVILAGVGNMLFTKTVIYRKLSRPIDRGRCFFDKRRIFGDNKTGIGFLSMIILAMLMQLLWGMICKNAGDLWMHNAICTERVLWISKVSTMKKNAAAGLFYGDDMLYYAFIGACFGFAYMICELPNSFIKRRIGIKPGKTAGGITGVLFLIIDQIDSLIGVVFVLSLIVPLTFFKALGYIALGGLTHITVNLILYGLKIRKNI